MEKEKILQVELMSDNKMAANSEYDIDRILYDLDGQIDLLSSKADRYDYLVAVGSGILCALLDILWVGDFSLKQGRDVASKQVDGFVKKTAKMLGYQGDDLESAVRFLENKFPIPSDGNTPVFGGGLQHHLRDFAHHPTIVGLMFSLLTQFTYKSYGTDVNGCFMVAEVPEKSKAFIGRDIPSKILFGTITWFFHLVSDMAGSSSTVGQSGGTGIPGPILSLAKELSVLPFFKNIKIGGNSLSIFLSKLFNGTLLAQRDESGAIIKDTVLRFDLRGELGIGIELGQQAVPVVANECIVRAFYFIRRLAMEMQTRNVQTLMNIKKIELANVVPTNNPTISRMLLIATGVFITLDIGEAVISQKYWVAVNYIGVGRFAVAFSEDVGWCLKTRNIKKIKQMYENIKQFAFLVEDNNIYKRIGDDMNNSINMDKFCLTMEQTEILYNIDYFKTLNDLRNTKVLISNERIKSLKKRWLAEWKVNMTRGFASFMQIEGAELHWYQNEKELIAKIKENNPQNTWFRLVMLEAMLFEPYYTLTLEKDKKGNDVPSKMYKDLQNIISGYNKDLGDKYLDDIFCEEYCPKGYIKRLRKCYDNVLGELNEVLKNVVTGLAVTAVVSVVIVATAGVFAPSIAVALVGSNFVGLHGAALTSACLAYLGGGAIAAGGGGMFAGGLVIVGGGAVLGLGVGAGVGGAVGLAGVAGKKTIIMQSAKLLVAVKEIFLNDEKDIEYSNSIYEQYVQKISEIEKGLVDLRLRAGEAKEKEAKEIKAEIKREEETVKAMNLARKSLQKFKSSFEIGFDTAQNNK